MQSCDQKTTNIRGAKQYSDNWSKFQHFILECEPYVLLGRKTVAFATTTAYIERIRREKFIACNTSMREGIDYRKWIQIFRESIAPSTV